MGLRQRRRLRPSHGLARISNVLGNEQSSLATIVSQGAALSAVLSQRSGQLFDLFGQSNLVLTVLEQRRSAIRQLLTATSTLSQQITSILSVNRSAIDLPSPEPAIGQCDTGEGQQRLRRSNPRSRSVQPLRSERHRVRSVRRRIGPDASDSGQRDRSVRDRQVGVSEQQCPGGVPSMRRVPSWARLAAVGTLVLAIAVGAIVVVAGSGPSQMTITALFSTAPGLYVGNQVKVLGMPVGSVTRVTPGPKYVTVQMQVPSSVAIPADAQALIMAPEVVNDRYVQLNPAYSGGPRMKDDAVIGLAQTAVPISVDGIIDSLDLLAKALGPKGANANGALSAFVAGSAHAFGPDGAALHSTLTSLGEALGGSVLQEPPAHCPVRQSRKPQLCGIALHRDIPGIRQRPGGREHRARFGRRRHRRGVVEPPTGPRVFAGNLFGRMGRHSETAFTAWRSLQARSPPSSRNCRRSSARFRRRWTT